jgi:hypothetical protein
MICTRTRQQLPTCSDAASPHNATVAPTVKRRMRPSLSLHLVVMACVRVVALSWQPPCGVLDGVPYRRLQKLPVRLHTRTHARTHARTHTVPAHASTRDTLACYTGPRGGHSAAAPYPSGGSAQARRTSDACGRTRPASQCRQANCAWAMPCHAMQPLRTCACVCAREESSRERVCLRVRLHARAHVSGCVRACIHVCTCARGACTHTHMCAARRNRRACASACVRA